MTRIPNPETDQLRLDVLSFVRDYRAEHRCTPTQREIASELKCPTWAVHNARQYLKRQGAWPEDAPRSVNKNKVAAGERAKWEAAQALVRRAFPEVYGR